VLPFRPQLDPTGANVSVTLQGKVGDPSTSPGPAATFWMGAGFNDPALPSVQMIGTDAVIAGFVNDQPFAIDHNLGAKQQCDYSATKAR
jgi:hypothetical protein